MGADFELNVFIHSFIHKRIHFSILESLDVKGILKAKWNAIENLNETLHLHLWKLIVMTVPHLVPGSDQNPALPPSSPGFLQWFLQCINLAFFIPYHSPDIVFIILSEKPDGHKLIKCFQNAQCLL